MLKVGFIGQGWIGKNYADDFERRGFSVVRYSLDVEYVHNKEAIAECDIVFIAVPTPTTSDGFDDHIVRKVLNLVGEGKIAVIKSTIVPRTTVSIWNENPGIFVVHSPEFLTEAHAAYDAAHPLRNIIGIPADTPEFHMKAEDVMKILPRAPFEIITSSESAEIIKYGSNCWLYAKVLYMNMLYDFARATGAKWEDVKHSLSADPRFGSSHMEPIHQNGRGAGGHCFIKDFKAFADAYGQSVPDDGTGIRLLEALQEKNADLLTSSGKDLELLHDIYGERNTHTYAENR